jgi:hypothetical protein
MSEIIMKMVFYSQFRIDSMNEAITAEHLMLFFWSEQERKEFPGLKA